MVINCGPNMQIMRERERERDRERERERERGCELRDGGKR